MKNTLLTLCLVGLIATSCSKTPNRFAIEKQNIGFLTDSTKVNQLEELLKLDSLVFNTNSKFSIGNNIEVFEKNGTHLLTLTPKLDKADASTIESIKILDERFKTPEGINTNSTFGDIKAKMKIKKIENTIRNIVLFLENSPIYLTIDKKELPSEFQFDLSKKIEAVNIPDTAKIKYFMIGW